MSREGQNKAANTWLEQAAEDLRLAKYAMKADPPFLKGAAFHAQQCAEKSIKAYLIFIGKRAPKTHDLRNMASVVSEHSSHLTTILDSVDTLTKYVIASRYPTDILFTKDSVLDAIKIADKVYQELYKNISQDFNQS